MTPQCNARNGELPARRTILLVEDEPFVREATCRILKHAGFEVLVAVDALEAMQVYDQAGKMVDLVMTDVGLPGRSGRQLGKDVHHLAPQIPVLLTSGYGEAAANAEREPLDEHTHYLGKPYSRASLVEKVEQILADNSSRRAAVQRG